MTSRFLYRAQATALVVAMILGFGPVGAQEAPTSDTPLDLSTGEFVDTPSPVQTPQEPTVYVKAIEDDWEIRCIRAAGQEDVCEMYQLLLDRSSTPTAEISMFRVDANDIGAGARIMTPLETLLTRGLTLSIDNGQSKRYPFNYCTLDGCIAQIGFTPDEVVRMKQGSEVRLTIVPATEQYRQSDVIVTMSLIGFTSAYDQLIPRGQ